MLTSIRSTDSKKVLARDVQKHEGPFLCPECKNLMVLKKGRILSHHFAHKVESSCEYGKGESIAHLSCKQEIYDCLIQDSRVTNCELEKSFGPGSVRSDIYFEFNGVKIGIEVQRSDLSVSDIFERTKRYADLGVYVLWLLLENEKRSNKSWIGWLHCLYWERVYYWEGKLEVKAKHIYTGVEHTEECPGQLCFYPKTFNILEDFCPENRHIPPVAFGIFGIDARDISMCKILIDNGTEWEKRKSFSGESWGAETMADAGWAILSNNKWNFYVHNYKQTLSFLSGCQKDSLSLKYPQKSFSQEEEKLVKKSIDFFEESLRLYLKIPENAMSGYGFRYELQNVKQPTRRTVYTACFCLFQIYCSFGLIDKAAKVAINFKEIYWKTPLSVRSGMIIRPEGLIIDSKRTFWRMDRNFSHKELTDMSMDWSFEKMIKYRSLIETENILFLQATICAMLSFQKENVKEHFLSFLETFPPLPGLVEIQSKAIICEKVGDWLASFEDIETAIFCYEQAIKEFQQYSKLTPLGTLSEVDNTNEILFKIEKLKGTNEVEEIDF